jgi:hypothetical protein
VVARRRTGKPLVKAAKLRDAFGLTAGKAAVAEALIMGMSPDEHYSRNLSRD